MSNPVFTPNDFQFLIDIAQLVVRARRMLSYSYAFRFYLKGMNKQTFFDFFPQSDDRNNTSVAQ